MSIAAAFAADKPAPFRAPAAAAMEHHQANSPVTIGVESYAEGEKVKAAFGKVDPYQYGVLPVLVVIQNDGAETLKLDKLKAEYVSPRGDRIAATPAGDVRYARGASRPNIVTGPVGEVAKRMKKYPLSDPVIEVRALAAPLLLARNSTSGFLYFRTGIEVGSTIYLTGITEARSGKPLLYFEIPLQ
ncbi:MAG TPA: hypothetical protein VGS58_00085 [Candidatus Sulfopaludibacter sp.]|nr:hypothetical protein [Candidatus Sulfopaludibacter sp.]